MFKVKPWQRVSNLVYTKNPILNIIKRKWTKHSNKKSEIGTMNFDRFNDVLSTRDNLDSRKQTPGK